jgi:hypothetical protein
MSLKTRIDRLQSLQSEDTIIVAVSTAEQKEALRKTAGAPMVILDPALEPGETRTLGTVEDMLALVALHGRQIHERQSHAPAG